MEKILDKFQFNYSPEIGIYVNFKTNIPLSLFYNPDTDVLTLLDQSKIPYEVTCWSTGDWKDAALKGIRGMIVRGSQAIGVTGAYCMVLACKDLNDTLPSSIKTLKKRANVIKESRPTAVNLSWAVNRVIRNIELSDLNSVEELREKVLETANEIFLEDLILNNYLRLNGVKYFKSGDVVLTHCNAGSLATAYGGSALSILAEVFNKGEDILVVSKETRPRSQGFKITLWELNRIGIPTVAVTDNMISKSIEKFKINKILVGADRITKDGAVTNKIGTFDIAKIAKLENIDFYVAASHSTLDLDIDGSQVPIEEREKDEVMSFYNYEIRYLSEMGVISSSALNQWPPEDILTSSDKPEIGKIRIFNPGFDTTLPEYVTKIIMDIGVFNPSDIINLSWDKIYSIISDLKKNFIFFK
ncbi:MAG: s-methyl-5-thioribose-1-phosphate isomerase [Candidatus Odinarchaeia archaeon]